jgi:uncharacterized repeat protein (TIGR01451 family)
MIEDLVRHHESAARGIRREGGRWGRALLLASSLLLSTATGAVAQPIVIDTFSTNQASLQLDFPPAGTNATSSVAGAGILGSERDMEIDLIGGVIAGNGMDAVVSSGFYSYSQDATIQGAGRIEWDGADGSPALNPTGLGGIDLTAGGTQDAFLLSVIFDDLPVDVVIEVYSDAGNASSLTFTSPGLIFVATNFVIPFSALTPTLGAGVDWTDVGAITLTLGSNITAPDVVIDFVQTTSTLDASKTVAIATDVDGDGNADPGDTLRYTVVISNPDDAYNASATGVVFTNPTPLNAELVIGSVTTTQGTVTDGNSGGDISVGVDIGTIADGASVTVTFDVVIDNPLPAGVTEITCQGVVSSDILTSLPTDDPAGGGPADPTVIPVVAAALVTATKVDGLLVDGNGNGQADPGETLRYVIVVTNNGDQAAGGVTFSNPDNPNTNLVAGSVTTSQGTVIVGNTAGDTTVAVDIGDIPGAGGSVTIEYQVVIDSPLAPGVTQVLCQGIVTGTNIPSTPTDDPDTPDPGDPTATPIVPVIAPPEAEIPTLGEWGMLLLVSLLTVLAMRRLKKVPS